MRKSLFSIVITLLLLTACTSQPQPEKDMISDNFNFAGQQLTFSFGEIKKALDEESQESREQREKREWGPLTNPRTIEPDGTLRLVVSRDWTSGFYPGELWYMYEYTGDQKWADQARHYTGLIEREKLNGGTHDMGFKMYCSYGNGYRLTNDADYRDILLQSARTLITRYKENVGCLRSWDHNTDKWQCPVIIDNMMNLELLFWAFKESGDSTFYNIAVNHANTTMKNHFRSDYSSYHVVDYDTITGNILNKHTHQGLAHESAWARGQAWALYGYTMCYRETQDVAYLEQAKHIENYLFTHPNMPEDLIPYWDFDAPEIPNEPRDASAAAVIASALYELSTYVSQQADDYRAKADKIMESLSSSAYRSPLNENRGFLLLHSTGSKPGNSEVDVPLVYADYYFLEALLRKKALLETDKEISAWRTKTKDVLQEQILKDAADYLKEEPITVTANTSDRSAGDIHDFFSEGDYWWPNPEDPQGPYIQRDGETNPDNFVAHRHAMVRFSRIVGNMASAWLITGDAKYAQHAMKHAKAWFVDPATHMNPNLLYAQAIKGRVTGRGIGIIDTIHLMEVVQGLIRMQEVLDQKDMDAIRSWFVEYQGWLMTHPYSMAEMNATNNHATCWVMQVASFAKFTGDEQVLEMCRKRDKEILLRQMAEDGSFPREINRTKPYGYSLFNLDAMATICQILSDGANDLWDYKTPEGQGIRKGIEFLYPYTADKGKWPYGEDVLYWNEWPVAQPFLLFGAVAFDKEDYFSLWSRLDHDPQENEVLRNLPIRNPLIWM